MGGFEIEDEEKNKRIYQCGFLSYRPEWLRRFGTTRYCVIIYSLITIIQGIEYTYKAATIETLQRRFRINDQLKGIVFLSNEVSQIVFALVLGYVSVKGKSHRPHWIAMGIFLSAITCFLMTSPHFIYENDDDSVQLERTDVPLPLGSIHSFRALSQNYWELDASLTRNSTGNTQLHQLCSKRNEMRNYLNLKESINSNVSKKGWKGSDNSDESNEDPHESEEESETLPLINCDLEDASYLTMFFIVVSEALAGICGLLFSSLGSPYLEESLDKTNSPAIFGITMAMKVIGPLLGYRLASMCLQIFTSPAVHTLTFGAVGDYDDQRIGAWWLGWLIIGALMLISSFFISLFPKYLPKPKKYRVAEAAKAKAMENDNLDGVSCSDSNTNSSDLTITSDCTTISIDTSESSCTSSSNNNNNNNDEILSGLNYSQIKDTLPKIESPKIKSISHSNSNHHAIQDLTLRENLHKLKREFISLLKNKINMFNNMSTLCYAFASTGYWSYMPQYLETVFMKSHEDAMEISNLVGFPAQAFGLLGCGWLISKFKPSARFLSAWNVFIAILYVVVGIGFTQMKCKTGNFNFLFNSEFDSDSEGRKRFGNILAMDLERASNCSSNCACDNVVYDPLCNPETKEIYFSPCHAGCSSFLNGSYGNCSCVAPDIELEQGICIEEGCTSNLILFLTLYGLLNFFEACGRIGNVLVSYRCVHPKKKGLAICFNIGLLCVFAYLPAPLLFGYIFDFVCVLWGTMKTGLNGKCSTKGPCWLYDGEKLRYIYNLTAAAFLLIGAIFDFLVWFYVKNLDLYDDSININRWESKKKKSNSDL